MFHLFGTFNQHLSDLSDIAIYQMSDEIIRSQMSHTSDTSNRLGYCQKSDFAVINLSLSDVGILR